MSSFASGCSCWYSLAASIRVASTQTVRAPSFCGAWAKPSLVVVPPVPPPPQAVRASDTVAAHPASNAARFFPNVLFGLGEGLLTVTIDSTGFAVPRADGQVARGI